MDDLKNLLAKRAAANKPKPNKFLHSPAHVLADEISSAFGERNRFAMYLGVINRVGMDSARRIYRQLQLEAKGDLGKLFMFLCRKEAKEAAEAAAAAGIVIPKKTVQKKPKLPKKPKQSTLL